MPYQVRLTVFEGPLDLLLQLIQRQELDITQVSLALVTDQYLQYIRELEVVGARELSEFLVIAAQLLLIKSRQLLPSAPIAPSAEEVEDEGQALVERLEAYRRYRAAARALHEKEDSRQRAFVRTTPSDVPAPPLPEKAASPIELLTALQTLLSDQPPAQPVSVVVSPVRIRITDQMRLIRERMRSQKGCTFRSLFSRLSSRMEVIVTFLALLELVRRGEIVALQEQLFGEILIRGQRDPEGAEPEEGLAGND
jgi:segregation and condensation protein A